jgi:hypothetical protein
MKSGSALTIASLASGAVGSALLASAQMFQVQGAYAGMNIAYAMEGAAGLAEARESQRESWHTLNRAAELVPLLFNLSIGFFVLCAAIAAYRAYRRWGVRGAWVLLELLAGGLGLVASYFGTLLAFIVLF